jgi:hypothetical protein
VLTTVCRYAFPVSVCIFFDVLPNSFSNRATMVFRALAASFSVLRSSPTLSWLPISTVMSEQVLPAHVGVDMGPERWTTERWTTRRSILSWFGCAFGLGFANGRWCVVVNAYSSRMGL